MSFSRRTAGPLGWLAALGFACLASSVLLRRRQPTASVVPAHLYQGAEEFQLQCYR